MPDTPQPDLSKIIEVEVAFNKMTASVIVHEPDSEQSGAVTPQDICAVLEKKGVKFGIDQDAIQEIVDDKKWGKRLVVAEGRAPVPGDDARLEFFFPTEKSLKPKIKEDGSVDYKDVSLVFSVEKGAGLVRKIPAKLGTDGMDVLGEVLAAGYGKDVSLSHGAGTQIDPEDSSLTIATTDGVVVYRRVNNRIEVHKIYVVRDSVDFSTGNVHVKSSVEIKGDVKPGFSVTTPYNVEVKGVVEHAAIACEGSLVVKAGITGNGVRIIEVGGDLHSGYIYNQPIRSDGSVYVHTEIRNARIESDDEVVVVKDNGVIIGGQITATNQISAAYIGNANNIPTVVEVGIHSKLKEELFHKEAEKSALEEEIDDIRKRATAIVKKSKMRGQEFNLDQLQEQWKAYSEQVAQIEQEIAELQESLYDAPSPKICVSKTIFPGTTVRIKHATLRVKGELTRVMFVLGGDEIHYLPLGEQNASEPDEPET